MVKMILLVKSHYGGVFIMAAKYLTVKDLEAMFQVGRGKILSWIKEGMPHLKIGRGIRFVETDVIKWIEENSKNK